MTPAHIAIATVAGADLVVSWNFKHIVHFEKIQKFNAVNLETGYKPILIFSPREVTKYGIKTIEMPNSILPGDQSIYLLPQSKGVR